MYARSQSRKFSPQVIGFLAVFSLQISSDEPYAQAATVLIRGVAKTCSDITQLDSALESNFEPFFSGWSAKDYTAALAWSEACSAYGWHVPGRDRIALLRSRRFEGIGAEPDNIPGSAPSNGAPAQAINTPPVATARPPIWSDRQELPSSGSSFIGFNATVTSHYKDSLPDIARRYGLGYEEIAHANPGIDMWIPGEGTKVFLPGRHRLPSGPREGIIIDVAERRLYFFPTQEKSRSPMVITYPVSIGMPGQNTPLGQTSIVAKVEHPSWHPPRAVRMAHAESGEALPAIVGPGPDNPLGDHMMRLGLGDGTFEIHGTNKPVSIGMDNTNGCIALYPEDIAALFALVEIGTPVRLINRSVQAVSNSR